MGTTKTISIGGWDFAETGNQILLGLNIENIEFSDNLIPRTLDHGTLVGNAFFSKQRVNAQVLFIEPTYERAYAKARLFTDYVTNNFYANNGGLLRFEINDRHGYGVFSSLTPVKFDPLLKQGGSVVEFDFTFTHPYFYANNDTIFTFNSDSVEYLHGLKFPTSKFKFYDMHGSQPTTVGVSNNGSVPAFVKFVFPNGGIDPVISIGGKRLEFEFNTNHEVVIDSKNQMTTIDGTPTPNVFKFGNSLKDVVLPVGFSRLAVTGRNTNGDSINVVLHFCDAFQTI